MIKTIPKKEKYKKAKCLSEEALQMAVKRREVKGKGEKKRYTHLNAEFQRIAKREKKAFLSDQCKKIEENNKMGKTRDLFKKNERYQGNISCKDGHNKGQKQYGSNRNRRYLKRWQEYTVQFSSVTQSCPTFCNPMNRCTPGLPVHHQLPEFTQTHVHRVSDAIQPSHPLLSPSPPAPNPSQHQSLFQ